MAGVINPYGAVPEALRELRLSISDVIGNAIKSRELDRRVEMDKANAEIQKAEVESNMKLRSMDIDLKKKGLEVEAAKDERNYGLDQKRMAIQEKDLVLRQNQDTREAEKFIEDKKNAEVLRSMHKAQTKQILASTARIGQEITAAKEMNTIKTTGEWASQFGIPKEMMEFFGIQSDGRIRGKDFKDMAEKVVGVMITNPSVGAKVRINTMATQAQDLLNKYNASPTPELKSQLQNIKSKMIQTAMFSDAGDLLKKKDSESKYREEYKSYLNATGIMPDQNPIIVTDPKNPERTKVKTVDEYVKERMATDGTLNEKAIKDLVGSIEKTIIKPSAKGTKTELPPLTDFVVPEKYTGGVYSKSMRRSTGDPTKGFMER